VWLFNQINTRTPCRLYETHFPCDIISKFRIMHAEDVYCNSHRGRTNTVWTKCRDCVVNPGRIYLNSVLNGLIIITLIILFQHSFIRGKGSPYTRPWGRKRGNTGIALPFREPRHEKGMGWVAPRPGRFTPGERDPVPIVQEAGWAPGPVWTTA
jgi:hypothetical protein